MSRKTTLQQDIVIEARSVDRRFSIGGHDITALAPVNIAVRRGELFVITGSSGSGKSTLLNLLSGLDRPSSGEVFFKGTSLSSINERILAGLRNNDFGFIFQTPHLLPDKTIFENVALPFRYGDIVDPELWRNRCLELLGYVGLSHLKERYPDTLSGGEMQRVVFARALSREPEIIFADEPTGSLDAENSTRLMTLLREQTRQGRTVIMVSHDAEAIAYGSKTLLLDKFNPGKTTAS